MDTKNHTLKKLETELQQQIANLELRIRSLEMSSKPTPLKGDAPQPRLTNFTPKREPTFSHEARSPFSKQLSTTKPEKNSDSLIVNEMGHYKINLVALITKIKTAFSPHSPPNPKLTTLLTAGSIEGPPLLRRERRITKMRFFIMLVFFSLISIGLFLALHR